MARLCAYTCMTSVDAPCDAGFASPLDNAVRSVMSPFGARGPGSHQKSGATGSPCLRDCFKGFSGGSVAYMIPPPGDQPVDR